MKKLIALYLAIFSAGILSAVLVSSSIVGKFIQASPFLLMDDKNFHSEFIVKKSISTVELVESGNFEELYRFNCDILLIFSNQLEPEIYDHAPARKLEIKELIAKAGKTEERLRDKGYCGE